MLIFRVRANLPRSFSDASCHNLSYLNEPADALGLAAAKLEKFPADSVKNSSERFIQPINP
jgi:hypothetical protein